MENFEVKSRIPLRIKQRGRQSWSTSQDVSGKLLADTPQIRFLNEEEDTDLAPLESSTKQDLPVSLVRGMTLLEKKQNKPVQPEKTVFSA